MKRAYQRNIDQFYQRQLGGAANWNAVQNLAKPYDFENPLAEFTTNETFFESLMADFANMNNDEFFNSLNNK